MKQIKTFVLAAAALLSASSCAPKHNLTGHIDLDVDTLIIQVRDADRKSREFSMDTVAVENGQFKTHVTDTSAKMLLFIPMEKDGRMKSLANAMFLPGDRMDISISGEGVDITGTPMYDALNGTAYGQLEKELDKLGVEFYRISMDGNADSETVNALIEKGQSLDKELEEAKMEQIRKEPASLASAYAASQLSSKKMVEAVELLDAKVFEGPLGPVLKVYLEAAKDYVAKTANWENLQPGVAAPDFKLKDLNGKEQTLQSFHGKYILLDFWGSWCGFCIKGFPEMKTYYQKYSDKIEFIGIGCRDSEEKWKAAVEKHGLPWTQLYSGFDDKVVRDYGVPGYPTKIVIDPEGRIVGKYVGEVPELYQKLDELF